MPDPVAFEFETAKQLMRLLKKSKDGTFNAEIDDTIPLDHAPAFIWAYVPSTVTCTYDSTVKAWIIGGATTCYPINSGVDADGLMQWGKNNSDGIVTGGITCTTFTPKLTSGQAAPVVGKGFYLGTIFGYNLFEQPRVLIGLPPVSGASGGSAVIEVVTDVVCTAENGLQVTYATFSGADYDNAVIKNFLGLSDVQPVSFAGNQGRVVKVNDTATALEFGAIGQGPSYTTFIALSDTPATYGESKADAYKTLIVGNDGVSIEFSTINVTTTNSLTGGGNPFSGFSQIKLVNDTASPGNYYQYCTNSSGIKGWYAMQVTPAGLSVGGQIVVSSRKAAVADVAAHTLSSADLAAAVSTTQTAIDDLTTQVNLLLARIRSHGLIAS